jgi:hypothetical protein
MSELLLSYPLLIVMRLMTCRVCRGDATSRTPIRFWSPAASRPDTRLTPNRGNEPPAGSRDGLRHLAGGLVQKAGAGGEVEPGVAAADGTES